MGKEQDLLQAVKCEDFNAVQRILAKVRKSKKFGSKKGHFLYQEYDGFSALHQAALNGNKNILALLLDSHIIPLDLKDNKGMRPLHYAAWQGKLEPVRLILRAGSDPNAPAHNGDSPLHLASQYDNFNVVEILLQYHANPTIQNKERKTALDLACEFGRQRVVELLLTRDQGFLLSYSLSHLEINSPLHLAAKNGHLNIIRLLLQSGLDINTETHNGTALHEAAIYGKMEVVKLLINFGIEVNRKNSEGHSALESVHKFTSSNAAQDIKKLLRDEADRYSNINIVSEVWKLQDDEESGVDVNSSVESMDKKDMLLNTKAIAVSTNLNVGFTSSDNSIPVLKKPSQSYENVLSDNSCTPKSFQRPHSDGITNYDHKSSNFNPHNKMKDLDRIYEWLKSHSLQEYTNNFTQAGYDFSTISRMTPEDLTAIGVNKPGHRKRIALMIKKLDISDGTPDYIPDDFLTWLKLLRLEHYYQLFIDNGYENIFSMIDLTWEDLQDIGITMLGHQKKIIIAINKLSLIHHNQEKLRSLMPIKGDNRLNDDVNIHSSYNNLTFFNLKKKSQQDSQESLQFEESNCSPSSMEPLQILVGSNSDYDSNSYIPTITSLKSFSSIASSNNIPNATHCEEETHLNVSFSTFKQPTFPLEKSEVDQQAPDKEDKAKSLTKERKLPFTTTKRSNSISLTQFSDTLINMTLDKTKEMEAPFGKNHNAFICQNKAPLNFHEPKITDQLHIKKIADPTNNSVNDNNGVIKHFSPKNTIQAESLSNEKYATIRKRSSRPRSKSFGESNKISKHISGEIVLNDTPGINHATLSYKNSSQIQEPILESNISSPSKKDKINKYNTPKTRGYYSEKKVSHNHLHSQDDFCDESNFSKENKSRICSVSKKQPNEISVLENTYRNNLSEINMAMSFNSNVNFQETTIFPSSDYYSQQYEQSALVLSQNEVSTFSDSDNDTDSILPFENENTDTIKKQPSSKPDIEEKINRLHYDFQTDKSFSPINSFIDHESSEDSELYNSIMMELHNKSQKEENVKDQNNVFGEIDTMFDDLHDQLNSMMKFS